MRPGPPRATQAGAARAARAADGRDKPWRFTGIGQSAPRIDITPEQHMVAGAVTAAFLKREFARLREWQQRAKSEPEPWQRAATMHGATLWLTSGGLPRLGEEIREFSLRHWGRVEDPEQRPEGARPVRVFFGTSVGLPGTEDG